MINISMALRVFGLVILIHTIFFIGIPMYRVGIGFLNSETILGLMVGALIYTIGEIIRRKGNQEGV